ncbi:MAG: site-specific integrase, partial [Dehalococcoidia bacterium]|nr:site-specific integrase [Dehalococcoidia bacterium]
HPKIASERLGHSSVALTLDTYSHAVEGMDKDAALQVQRAIRGAA